jgi:hypothetical protein
MHAHLPENLSACDFSKSNTNQLASSDGVNSVDEKRMNTSTNNINNTPIFKISNYLPLFKIPSLEQLQLMQQTEQLKLEQLQRQMDQKRQQQEQLQLQQKLIKEKVEAKRVFCAKLDRIYSEKHQLIKQNQIQLQLLESSKEMRRNKQQLAFKQGHIVLQQTHHHRHHLHSQQQQQQQQQQSEAPKHAQQSKLNDQSALIVEKPKDIIVVSAQTTSQNSPAHQSNTSIRNSNAHSGNVSDIPEPSNTIFSVPPTTTFNPGCDEHDGDGHGDDVDIQVLSKEHSAAHSTSNSNIHANPNVHVYGSTSLFPLSSDFSSSASQAPQRSKTSTNASMPALATSDSYNNFHQDKFVAGDLVREGGNNNHINRDEEGDEDDSSTVALLLNGEEAEAAVWYSLINKLASNDISLSHVLQPQHQSNQTHQAHQVHSSHRFHQSNIEVQSNQSSSQHVHHHNVNNVNNLDSNRIMNQSSNAIQSQPIVHKQISYKGQENLRREVNVKRNKNITPDDMSQSLVKGGLYDFQPNNNINGDAVVYNDVSVVDKKVQVCKNDSMNKDGQQSTYHYDNKNSKNAKYNNTATTIDIGNAGHNSKDTSNIDFTISGLRTQLQQLLQIQKLQHIHLKQTQSQQQNQSSHRQQQQQQQQLLQLPQQHLQRENQPVHYQNWSAATSMQIIQSTFPRFPFARGVQAAPVSVVASEKTGVSMLQTSTADEDVNHRINQDSIKNIKQDNSILLTHQERLKLLNEPIVYERSAVNPTFSSNVPPQSAGAVHHVHNNEFYEGDVVDKDKNKQTVHQHALLTSNTSTSLIDNTVGVSQRAPLSPILDTIGHVIDSMAIYNRSPFKKHRFDKLNNTNIKNGSVRHQRHLHSSDSTNLQFYNHNHKLEQEVRFKYFKNNHESNRPNHDYDHNHHLQHTSANPSKSQAHMHVRTHSKSWISENNNQRRYIDPNHDDCDSDDMNIIQSIFYM